MNHSKKIIAETKFLRLVERDRWVYVERANASGVVCVVARTADDRILLVEQYRIPVDAQVIELPAGLAGDSPDQSDEAFELAAQRELIEETGYRAKRLVRKASIAASAGLTNEVITFFIADGLEKIAAGGGEGRERIVVHEIPLAEADDWLADAQAEGKLIDGRIYAGLHFLEQMWES
ncbi:MAG: NUDIX hydrolase [Planctomycetaceae bacterium]